jgi:two-component system, LytTR family, response regulator
VRIRVVIADDEPVARRGLRHLLLEHDDVAVVGEARNGREVLQAVSTLAPDLLLLDVQMPGADGFEVLRRLEPPPPYVIFVTAYDDYAVRAFENHALDYLLKPVHAARFGVALERARERIRSAVAVEEAHRLAAFLGRGAQSLTGPSGSAPGRLVVPSPNGAVVLDLADVTWIEADGYYAVIHAHGTRHLLRESLDSLVRRLDPGRFVRVHRSAIVSLEAVRAFRRTGGESSVVLRDETSVPISRRRRALVENAIRHFASRRSDGPSAALRRPLADESL